MAEHTPTSDGQQRPDWFCESCLEWVTPKDNPREYKGKQVCPRCRRWESLWYWRDMPVDLDLFYPTAQAPLIGAPPGCYTSASDLLSALNQEYQAVCEAVTALGYDLNSPVCRAEQDRLKKALEAEQAPQKQRQYAKKTRPRRKPARGKAKRTKRRKR